MGSEKQWDPVWIGPTKCDDDRISREQDLDKAWANVKPVLEGDNFKPSAYGIVPLALDLLREALSCYQNGAYLAACGMCRASIEAAVYLATAQKPSNRLETVRIRDYDNREKRKKFLAAAVSDGLLSQEECKSVERIWEAGDFAMHIHQRWDYHYKAVATNPSLIEDDPTLLKWWSNRQKALETITDTAKILSQLLYKLNSMIGVKG
jgi:hypothetical protein